MNINSSNVLSNIYEDDKYPYFAKMPNEQFNADILPPIHEVLNNDKRVIG